MTNEEAKDYIREWCPYDRQEEIIQALEQEPKTGHWEWNQYDANPKIGNYHCTNCHSVGRVFYSYCPNCGARMAESEV